MTSPVAPTTAQAKAVPALMAVAPERPDTCG
jgi:hypothetical protein